VFGLPQNVVITLIEHCFIVGGDKINIAYIDAVAKKWAEEGIHTQELAQQQIEEHKAFSSGAKRVMKEMGVTAKNPGATEMGLYKKWTDDWGFTLEAILYAMRGKEFASASQPFKYLDGILNALRESGALTARKISEYNSARDRKREDLKDIFTTLGYASKSITPRHERFYESWRASGYPQSMVLAACEQTVNRGSKRFEAVDALLGEWRALGLDTQEQIQSHVQRQDELKTRVQQVFECAGIKKPVGDSDRRMYVTCVNDHHMSHDVLMYAAEISSISAAEPLPYLRKILQEWAKNGVTTLEMARRQEIDHTAAIRRDDRKTFAQREYTAEDKERRKLDIVADMERVYEV
jgi:DnaD/phage-associated family protein